MSLYNDASLVMIPSAYKDGKLYSIKPTDGSGDFTFSRGSNLAATRVDENGLIEKGRENLLLQSNQFDTTWSTVNTGVTSGQSGYDGSSDAWLLSKSAASASLRQSISSSGVHSFSIYAKAGSLNWVALQLSGGVYNYVYFDLSTGNIGTQSNNIDAIATSIGSGWYRISIVASNAVNSVWIYPADGDNDLSGTSGSIYIQDAQVEQGLVATDYIETTTTTAQAGILEDMPRLDYSGGASCPSLLLEPQRTNALNHSEYFDAWSKYGGASVTNNAATSPEGVQNASLLSSGTTTALYNPNGAGSASQAYTASIYVKKISYTTFRMGMTDDTLEEFSWYFNLDTLATSAAGTPSVWTNTSAYAEDAGNGWIRCVVTGTKGAAGIARMIVKGETTFAPDFYIYGAMLEVGSYPTSYIPCYGAATTRSGDSCVATSVSNLIGQTQGSFFVDFVWNGLSNNVADNVIMSLGAQNYGVSNIAISNYNGSLYARVTNGISIDANIFALILVAGTRYKCLVTYADNDVKFYVNGYLKGEDTSVSIPAVSDVYLQNNHHNSKQVNQSLTFPTILTDAECIALTTI